MRGCGSDRKRRTPPAAAPCWPWDRKVSRHRTPVTSSCGRPPHSRRIFLTVAAASGPGYPLEIFEELLHEVGHANGGGTNTGHIPTSCPQLESTNTCPKCRTPWTRNGQSSRMRDNCPTEVHLSRFNCFPGNAPLATFRPESAGPEPGARLSQPRSMMCDSITTSGCEIEHPVDRTEMRRP